MHLCSHLPVASVWSMWPIPSSISSSSWSVNRCTALEVNGLLYVYYRLYDGMVYLCCVYHRLNTSQFITAASRTICLFLPSHTTTLASEVSSAATNRSNALSIWGFQSQFLVGLTIVRMLTNNDYVPGPEMIDWFHKIQTYLQQLDSRPSPEHMYVYIYIVFIYIHYLST